MKAINISAREIADLKDLPKGWCCISINEEHYDYYPIGFDQEGKDERILRVRFSDVTAPISKIAHDNMVFNPINDDTAKKIVDFIEENKGKNLLVHCAAGVSRSAAVCLYAHLTYSHGVKDNFWALSHPNKFVLGALLVSRLYARSLE